MTQHAKSFLIKFYWSK